MKISQEWNSFRTSNLDHRALRTILHLGSLSICTERVIYIQNPRVTKIVFHVFLLLSFRCNVTRHHINVLSYFSCHSVQFQKQLCNFPAVFIIHQAFSRTMPWQLLCIVHYMHSAMDATPINQVLNNAHP